MESVAASLTLQDNTVLRASDGEEGLALAERVGALLRRTEAANRTKRER
ncbi:MAG: hypothetical protein V3V62_04080 [bacterium]